MTATEADKLVQRIRECVEGREPMTLFGVDYVPADDVGLLETTIVGIEAENTKLRMLCVEALGWLRWAGGITCPPEVPDKFADELRELGIGVDG